MIAGDVGATASEVALAWVLHQGSDIVPIVGTRSLAHLRANADATALHLDPATLARLDAAFSPGVAAGERYAPDLLRRVEG